MRESSEQLLGKHTQHQEAGVPQAVVAWLRSGALMDQQQPEQQPAQGTSEGPGTQLPLSGAAPSLPHHQQVGRGRHEG